MSSTGDSWFVARDGQQTGPFTRAQLDTMLRSGKLLPFDHVWCPDFPDWMHVKDAFPPVRVPAAPAPAPRAPARPANVNDYVDEAEPYAAADMAPARQPRAASQAAAGRPAARAAEYEQPQGKFADVKQGIVSVLLSPRGRIRRGQFWLAVILVLIGGYGLTEIAGQAGGLMSSLVWLYVSVTVYGKRLHDMGRSMWHVAWPYLLSLIFAGAGGFILANPKRMDDFMLGMSIAIGGPVIVWLIATIILGVMRGQKTDNRFGPSPYESKVIASAPGR